MLSLLVEKTTVVPVTEVTRNYNILSKAFIACNRG